MKSVSLELKKSYSKTNATIETINGEEVMTEVMIEYTAKKNKLGAPMRSASTMLNVNREVRQTFKISNVGTIAGCYVISGKVERNAGVRVIRENVVIHDGHLATLKRFKDDVKEVTKGFECGIQIENYNDIKEGDVIEAYIMEEIKR